MKIENDSYRSCAQDIATQITNQSAWVSYIKTYLNFWRIANAFTTLIDFFEIAQKPNLFVGKTTFDRFQNLNSPGWWYDDYSWWIVAFLRADQYSNRVGVYNPTWRELAQTCWDEMAPATKVWDHANQKEFAKAKPRFDGGCWNHGFVSDTSNPCDPLATETFCGIQNTVTNTQYLVCAARLSQDANATTEYEWLRSWFTDASLLDDQKLLATYQGVGQLVRERVSTFAKAPDNTYPQAPNYDKDRHWTGDQGILLGALLEMVRLDPGGQGVYYPMAKAILDAVRTKLVKGQILQPWTPKDTIGSQYLTDYATGVGVFMRYLLYVYNSGDQVLKPYIASAEYRQFIQANADAVCASVGKCPPLPDGSQMDQMECLLNQLAVLNAAIVILAQ